MRTLRLVSWIRWVGTMSIWPLELARYLLQRQASSWRRAATEPSMNAAPAAWTEVLRTGPATGLWWTFDLARTQHAAGVQAGLCERSLLASADFERRLDLLERLTLGPLARRV